MSFQVISTRDGQEQKLKFKIGSSDTSERVLQMLRAGYLLEGGFLINGEKQIVFEVERNGVYHFVDFKKRSGEGIAVDSAQSTSEHAFTSTSTTPSGEKKKEKRKMVSDPLAPKKPITSFFLYSQEFLHETKENNPSLSHKEVMALLGRNWGGMSELEKKKYNDKAKKTKEKYDREFKAFCDAHPDSELAKQTKLNSDKKSEKLERSEKRHNEASAKAESNNNNKNNNKNNNNNNKSNSSASALEKEDDETEDEKEEKEENESDDEEEEDEEPTPKKNKKEVKKEEVKKEVKREEAKKEVKKEEKKEEKKTKIPAVVKEEKQEKKKVKSEPSQSY